MIVQGPKGELACTRINRAHRKPSRWQRPDRAQSRTRSSRRCRGTRGCVGEADRVHASARVGWQGAREEGVRAYPARFVPPRMPAGSLGLSSAELARASLFIARLCRCTPGRLGMPRATRKRTSAPGPPTSAPGPAHICAGTRSLAGPDGTIGFGAGRGKVSETTPSKVGTSGVSGEPLDAPGSAERFSNAEGS